MRILRKGMKGTDVERWQNFLAGQGFSMGQVDGDFGKKTVNATMEFQTKHGLTPDGIVGIRTMGLAMTLGFEAIKDPTDKSTTGPNFPPLPDFKSLNGLAARQKVFGKFAFKHKPLPNNPEHIVITDGWEGQNIVRVTIPQLVGVEGATFDGGVRFHKLAVDQLVALWAAWEKAKLLDRVFTYGGDFNPRFVRKKIGVLSNHAFGSAFDINAAFNPLGTQPALVGKKGSVRELVTIANQHGFFWGGHFSKRPDGMHFEVAFIK
jgi:D-alanyl-D-alanine carboxypeptidase/Putative peptidoglycan binding domain